VVLLAAAIPGRGHLRSDPTDPVVSGEESLTRSGHGSVPLRVAHAMALSALAHVARKVYLTRRRLASSLAPIARSCPRARFPLADCCDPLRFIQKPARSLLLTNLKAAGDRPSHGSGRRDPQAVGRRRVPGRTAAAAAALALDMTDAWPTTESESQPESRVAAASASTPRRVPRRAPRGDRSSRRRRPVPRGAAPSRAPRVRGGSPRGSSSRMRDNVGRRCLLIPPR